MNPSDARQVIVLKNDTARIEIDLGGGSISAFRLQSNELNPLNFDSWSLGSTPDAPPTPDPRASGHFLCLDRWGPATAAEEAHGMPPHGEASAVWWKARGSPDSSGENTSVRLSAVLPLAGLKVDRSMSLAGEQSCFVVTETVTNTRPLGRIYNCVQHPSIAPPFLDRATVVDCNGTRGFMQTTPMPDPEKPEVHWPEGLNEDGSKVDLRRLGGKVAPWVVSFIIEEDFGWVTAASPTRGLLFGYLWPREDYPWFSLWSHLEEGKPAARGLEFGTTGLHRPEPDLVTKGRIFDRPLYRHIDADESQSFRYAAFLAEIPDDYAGSERVEYRDGGISIFERDNRSRIIRLETGRLF